MSEPTVASAPVQEASSVHSDRLRAAGLDPIKLMPLIEEQAAKGERTVEAIVTDCCRAMAEAQRLRDEAQMQALERAAWLARMEVVVSARDSAPPSVSDWFCESPNKGRRAQRARGKGWRR